MGPDFQIQYAARLQASTHYIHMEETRTTTHSRSVMEHSETIQMHYVQCKASYMKSLDIVKKVLAPKTQMEQIFDQCGQWPCATPYTLFRCLASTSPIKPPENWKKCLISLALLALELQQAQRLLQFALKNLDEVFSKELENEGGDRWLAADYPGWLLIQVHIPCPESLFLLKLTSQSSQLQGNFLICCSQVDVAKEIIAPHSGENTIMQVNMGKGKSSVIIPICAAALTNSCQLVQVIVPKALKMQMLQLLANRLSGLVGMQIHHLTLSHSGIYPHVDFIRKVMNEHGILVMTSEDVLAVRLTSVDGMINDTIKANSLSTVQRLDYDHLLTEQWLKSVSMVTLMTMTMKLLMVMKIAL